MTHKPVDAGVLEGLEEDRSIFLKEQSSFDPEYQGYRFDSVKGDEYRQIALDAVAELKALRKWRTVVSEAILKWSSEPMNEDVDGVLIGAFFDAETELNSEIQSNNRS